MKIKRIVYLILFVLYASYNDAYSQHGFVRANDSCCTVLNKGIRNDDENFTTYYSSCRINDISTIFTIVNDTIDGDFYGFYPSGSMKFWYVFKMGKFMNLKILSDSFGNQVDIGTLKDGNGYINSYEYTNSDGFVVMTSIPISRSYFQDGIFTGRTEIIDSLGRIIGFYNGACANYYYRVIHEVSNDSEYVSLYIPLRPCDDDTLYKFCKNNIVGWKVLPDGSDITLKASELYVPIFYQTKENLIFLNKIRKKLIKLERKGNRLKYFRYFENYLRI